MCWETLLSKLLTTNWEPAKVVAKPRETGGQGQEPCAGTQHDLKLFVF